MNTSSQKQERLKFVQEQILLLRGFLSNPDTFVSVSGDGMSESWMNRADAWKELKALELEEKRLLGQATRIRYADTRNIAR